jgi:hypothetical protein
MPLNYDADFSNWSLMKQCPFDKGYIKFFEDLKEGTACIVMSTTWDPRDPRSINMIMYYRGFEEHAASNEYAPVFTFLRDKDMDWEWSSRWIFTYNEMDDVRNAGLLLYAKIPPNSVRFITED